MGVTPRGPGLVPGTIINSFARTCGTVTSSLGVYSGHNLSRRFSSAVNTNAMLVPFNNGGRLAPVRTVIRGVDIRRGRAGSYSLVT